MTQTYTIRDANQFAIEYAFFDDSHDTELAMYINGLNVLAFEKDGVDLTTRWNLGELAFWLRSFVDHLAEEPFPVECCGEYAAQKDDIAREFDSDNEEIFDAYYQRLYDWNIRHRWHGASSGAVLADVFFQLVDGFVEISWDNRGIENDVVFKSLKGGERISRNIFESVVNDFLIAYAAHWF